MSSESDEEDFVAYGTPLEPLDEDTIPKKRALSVEDQVAKDKHGRRRFHGAFTGGFSAGFFNTVGSLEGWKPSQFKSSRSSKSKAQFQRPEDFMDDEDMDEFGIAPKALRPKGDYSQEAECSSKKRHHTQFSDGAIPGIPVLKTLIEPVRETIGIRLLKKMGWKHGQGVGPRLSKLEKHVSRKSQKQVKIYGCALPNEEMVMTNEISDDSEEDEYCNVTFAPDDFEPWIVKPKDDYFGLGYSGLDRRPVLSSHIDLFGPPTSSLVMQEKKKKVNIRGQAFGVGAFEREDEDIYATEDMSQYDFALDTPKMLADKRQQERKVRLTNEAPSSSSNVLEGFVLSSAPLVRKTYSPPILPPGFTPHHLVRPSRFSESKGPDNGGERSKVTDKRLTAAERAVIVNEPESASAKQQVITEVERTVPHFRPFVADPEKQERYEKYLTLSKQEQPERLKDLQPFTMTEWERERERVEFEQAARLYRPLSAAFSDRFVQATSSDDATDPLVPVTRSTDADQDVKNAAKMKMFGKLTRRISEWTPHNTLCKRFNIPSPRSSSSSLKPNTKRPKFSVFNFLDAAPFNKSASSNLSEDLSENSTKLSSKYNSKENPTETLSSAETSMEISSPHESSSTPQEKEENLDLPKDDDMEKLANSTCKMDLYKAIFLSSSDESDNDEGREDKSKTSTIEALSATEQNVLRNSSPPRGIFANLDIDTLNKTKREPSVPETSESTLKLNVLRNTSPPRGIFANLDLDSLKSHNTSKNINIPVTESQSKNIEQQSNNTIRSEGSELFGPLLPSRNQHPSISEHNDKSSNSSFPEQSESKDLYGPSLPTNNTRLRERDIITKDCSSDSEMDWVEMNNSIQSDSDKSEKHSSTKKHSKKSHRKSKKHKEKRPKHKKKKKK